MNGRSVSEPTRERETFKYDPTLLTDIIYNADGRPINNSILRTGADAVLTSIASLGASRLKTAASLVSLFDQKWQFIVAEATPSITLSPHARAENRHGEQLWLCGTAIPRCDGVCEHTLISQNPQDFEEVGESDSDLPLSLVEDLAQDARHSTKPWCLPGSPARFYAAVPIRSKRGINIGVYCVIDTVPRTEWDERSSQTMRQLSRTIMDYLELRRSKHEYRHSERMTRGLGSFVGGKATTTGLYAGIEGLVQDGAEGSLNANQQSLERERDAKAARRDSDSRSVSPGTPLERPTAKVTGGLGMSSLSSPSTSSVSAVMNMVYSPAIERGPVPTPMHASHDGPQSAKEIFSKAANLIRESIEIEGVLFLDATLKSFGGLTNSPLGADNSTSATPSDESDDLAFGKVNAETQSPCCDVLGFSTSQSSSIDGAEDVPRHTSVPEKLLMALSRRYPKGKIFAFDEHGALESGDSSDGDNESSTSPFTAPKPKEHHNRSRNPWSRHRDGAFISDIFKGARSVAFVPVWDAKRERYYAGCFAFTRVATRIFTEESELGFLRAFGMLTMSETYRLEATMANKAKSDVLSSLSHELRSPLHGVVLGVELLHDTQLDVFQGDVLHTIETCGRTLSDTIDHLLDFAKINNYKAVEKQQRKQGFRGLSRKERDSTTSIEDGMKSLVADVQLDVLAEEVLESVAAGSTFQRMSIAQLHRRDKRHIDRKSNQHLDSLRAVEDLGAEELHQLQTRNVSIYLDIEPSHAWAFRVSPGSFRRILMNLFGNSLKYTREGTIRVSLTQEHSSRKGRTRHRVVKITVADTGKGISEDFLRNELFKPFSQEDALAPGTGLGLSLVKQMVSTLGGTISISSGVNVGTKITVALPLTPATPAATPSPLPALAAAEEDQDFGAHLQRLKGLRVKLFGFKRGRTQYATDDKLQDFDDYAFAERLCRDWLGLEVVPDDPKEVSSDVPDLLLCTEPGLDNFESNRPPTVVLCANSLVAHYRATSAEALGLQGVMEFISQPVGPRKLAKTLSRVHQRWSEDLTPFSPMPVQSPQPSERRLSDVLPIRPKLVRSHTTSDSRLPLAARASLQREQIEPDVNTEAPIQDLAPSAIPQLCPAAAAPPEIDKAASTEPVAAVPPATNDSEEAPVPSSADDLKSADKLTPAEPVEPLEFLLVDDNPINLKILSSYMKKLNRAYTTAADGQEAVDAFCRGGSRFQVVFMDISMPRLNGFEATRQIRAFEREMHLPPAAIFALSGLASADAQQEAWASGIDLFLAKPVRLKELSSILSTRGFL